jgi:ketosteroid isomerase-like protein
MYAEDAMMLPPNQPMVRGKQAIKAFNQRMLDQVGGTISNRIVEFSVEGDLAYQVGTYAIRDAKTPDEGKFVNIFRRQQDGSWKIHLAIYNNDKPVPTVT